MLDSALGGLGKGDNQHHQELASLKKILKGDATWMTRKVAPGWVIDTVNGTLELSAHRVNRAKEILNSIKPSQRRMATSRWHKVLGELRSMAVATPGSGGLFSTLQEAFRHPEDQQRLRLHKRVHDF